MTPKGRLNQLIQKEKSVSRKTLWGARAVDATTALIGASASIPTFGSSIVLSELIESLPEIAYTAWRGHKQRKALRKMITLVQEIHGINSPTEIMINNYMQPQRWEDLIIEPILELANPNPNTNTKREKTPGREEIVKDAIKRALPILIKSTWKEILDLIPVVNRISMRERQYLKILKLIEISN